MPRGGRRAGSGRKPGRATQKSQQIAVEARDAGLTPLGYMLEVMRDPNATVARKDEMARASAPFCHPRLNAIAVTPDTKTIDVTPRADVVIHVIPRGFFKDPVDW